MINLTTTVVVAFIVVLICLAGLAVSLIFTGKSSIKPGACGRDPTKKKDDQDCGDHISCSLCEKDDKKSKKK